MTYQDGPHVFLKKDDLFEVVNFSLSGNKPVQYESWEGSFPNHELNTGYAFPVKLEKKIPREETLYPLPSKIAAIGDIHGEYEVLVDLMVGNKIIDQNLNWTWDENHLVFCGDIFDRGHQVTECLWLIHHLEQQAAEKGGKVHYLLGNHEHMAMTGDYRYLNRKYKNIYSWTSLNYSDLFQTNTYLGNWLRSRNAVIKIGPYLFVHAGISPAMAELGYSLEQVNRELHLHLQEGLPEPEFLLNSLGPLWYRGYLMSWNMHKQTSNQEINLILKQYQADHIIFAHTNVSKITPLYNHKLIAIDIPVEKDLKNAQLLLIESGNFFAGDLRGNKIRVE